MLIPLWDWVLESQAGYDVPPESVRMNREPQESPVWSALVSRGIAQREGPGETVVDFDLLKHPASQAALVACALLGGIGLIVMVVESETYIADGYSFLHPHVAAGLIGLAFFLLVLLRVQHPGPLPAGIPYGLAVVGGIASGAFSYGGLVLANRPFVEAIPASYSVGNPCSTLVPADPGMPRIIFSVHFSDYWCQFKGEDLMIPVRTGLFGTYQFDQGRYAEDMREFERQRAGS